MLRQRHVGTKRLGISSTASWCQQSEHPSSAQTEATDAEDSSQDDSSTGNRWLNYDVAPHRPWWLNYDVAPHRPSSWPATISHIHITRMAYIKTILISHAETTHNKSYIFHGRYTSPPTVISNMLRNIQSPDWHCINQLTWTTHALTLAWREEYIHGSGASHSPISQRILATKVFSEFVRSWCVLFSLSTAMRSHPAYYTWVHMLLETFLYIHYYHIHSWHVSSH